MLVITFGYFKGVLKDSVPLHCFKKNMFPVPLLRKIFSQFPLYRKRYHTIL